MYINTYIYIYIYVVNSYTTDEFQSDYTATVYESYTATIPINDKPIELNLV